ncbi:hypothetical protein TNCV_952751 [Trichonephila clavipes]|nr:hypothetical protein TNCV_952751 [Trichonephila clavipes]
MQLHAVQQCFLMHFKAVILEDYLIGPYLFCPFHMALLQLCCTSNKILRSIVYLPLIPGLNFNGIIPGRTGTSSDSDHRSSISLPA